MRSLRCAACAASFANTSQHNTCISDHIPLLLCVRHLWPLPHLVNVLLLLLLQKHYDFGMRALKAVLVMAGSLKRRSPNVPEEIVLIQAMRNANLPKLLSEVRRAAPRAPTMAGAGAANSTVHVS
jgi:hypothetical protein